MRLSQVLFSQGFGSRRHCAGLVAAGLVRIGGQVVDDPDADLDTEGLVFEVEGRAWPFHAQALVLLHKPAGYECSQKPRHHPSVMSLLPPPLRERGVQPIGRLDEDTTGLLLLTDDGALIHRLTSPKHHVPKVYEVTARHPLTPEQLQRLRDGVVLDDSPQPVRAVAAEATGETTLRLTLTEGKYHQVKRMLAAVGNRCDALHRSAFGALTIPDGLATGQWCWADPAAITPSR
ncbi:MAG: 16S rRNA pseudouridine(516) synthase [Rubrivivax sp.]|jgi:16S rRNA pseudouridine516 synthase|nr:16S rRNA pseudouridine(516) synthase [Rubrivivax sp.]